MSVWGRIRHIVISRNEAIFTRANQGARALWWPVSRILVFTSILFPDCPPQGLLRSSQWRAVRVLAPQWRAERVCRLHIYHGVIARKGFAAYVTTNIVIARNEAISTCANQVAKALWWLVGRVLVFTNISVRLSSAVRQLANRPAMTTRGDVFL